MLLWNMFSLLLDANLFVFQETTYHFILLYHNADLLFHKMNISLKQTSCYNISWLF